MVKTELLSVGDKVYMIDKPHVRGIVCGLRPLGQKNWFKVQLKSGDIRLVQKGELWQLV